MNCWLNRSRPFFAAMAALIMAVSLSAPLSAGSGADAAICSFPELGLPERAKIYTAAGYRGEPLGWSIEDSGHDTTFVRVAVNSPEAPVILILGAYEPNVWQIGWTEGTEILAVVAAGHHTQKVSGLRPEVPVLISTARDKGPCGYFYSVSTLSQIMAVNDFAKALFHRELEAALPVTQGQVMIGRPLGVGQKLLTAQNLSRESTVKAGTPLDGLPGLEEALARGLIRPATASEHHRWRGEALRAQSRRNPKQKKVDESPATREGSDYPQRLVKLLTKRRATVSVYEAYMVLSPDFVIPGGLEAQPALTFLVPAGQKAPERAGRSNCEVLALD